MFGVNNFFIFLVGIIAKLILGKKEKEIIIIIIINIINIKLEKGKWK